MKDATLEKEAPLEDGTLYLSAKQAAAELDVSLPTLYAYVSRDQIRSEPVPHSRARRYRAEDVRAFKKRRIAKMGDGGPVLDLTHDALQFGQPILDSSITLIAEGRLFYRGSDATKLAEHGTLESVAALLWDCPTDPFKPDVLPPEIAALPADIPAFDRCLVALPLAAVADETLYNSTIEGLAATGVRILRLVAATIAGTPPSPLPVHKVLQNAWGKDDEAGEAIRAALVLCADHELNASAFTARCAAAAGSTLYACVMAGLAALQGSRHGGISRRTENLLREFSKSADPAGAVRQRLRDQEPMPGFSHWLYPDGDPRAKMLMRYIAEHRSETDAFARVNKVIETMKSAAGIKPNVDLALAAVGATYDLPPGAALSLFALGRTAGLVAHAIEQSNRPGLIRPRARYTGPVPK
ncbi:MAG: citrate synthase family protein [Parvibaculum sp.]